MVEKIGVKTFDFKTNCFYCEEECLEVDAKHLDKWWQYNLVRTTDRPNRPQAILENCDIRQDDF